MNGAAQPDPLPLPGTFHPAGFVVGMAAEARLLRGCGAVAIGGGTPEGAARAAETLARDGAGALVSAGLAGGLDPALRPGAIVVPEAVWTAGASHATDPALNALLGGPNAALLAAAEAPAATRSAKAALFQGSHAAAVDLESGAVAEIATRHGLPFAALRVICDPAERDLPPAALAALDSQGGIALLRIIGSLLRNPFQLPALLRLAADAAAARAALRDVAARLKP